MRRRVGDGLADRQSIPHNINEASDSQAKSGCEEQSQVVHKKMSTDAINLIRPSSIEVHAFVARQNQHTASARRRRENPSTQ